MPKSQLMKKAGKITFLLVCLFLCSACGQEKTVFVAGEDITISGEETAAADDPAEGAEQPVEESEQQIEEAALPSDEETGRININTADVQELMTLPGIGETRAAAIIEYRTSVGKFEKEEDLMNVKGIKNGIFSKISSLICVK